LTDGNIFHTFLDNFATKKLNTCTFVNTDDPNLLLFSIHELSGCQIFT